MRVLWLSPILSCLLKIKCSQCHSSVLNGGKKCFASTNSNVFQHNFSSSSSHFYCIIIPFFYNMVSHHAVGSTDSMLLSWGSSVNVCEDSRRTIRQEVDRIDSDIANLHGKTKSEDRVSSQVIKDLSHARAEMYNYRRGAADILDNATMNDQVRARLMESLKADLLIPLRKTSMSSDKNHSSSEDIPLDLSINQQSTNAMSFLEKRMYMDILQAATEKMKNVREIKCQKHTLLEKMNKIHSRMLQDNLENNCAESKQIMSNQAIETENEERRMRTIKIAVHEGRNKCGSHAQDIADRVGLQNAEVNILSLFDKTLTSLTLTSSD